MSEKIDIVFKYKGIDGTPIRVSTSMEGDISFSPKYAAKKDLYSPIYVSEYLLEVKGVAKADKNGVCAVMTIGDSSEETPTPEKVIFNNPATIVYWTDGTKTVVKAYDEDFDKEKGLAMAYMKKIHGNKGNYNDVFRKWIEE